MCNFTKVLWKRSVCLGLSAKRASMFKDVMNEDVRVSEKNKQVKKITIVSVI